MKNKSSLIKNSIFVVVLLIVVLVVIFSINDFSKIVENFKNLKLEYLFYSLGITILYLLTWSCSLFIILKKYKSKMNNTTLFLVSNTDLFFNGITPFSTGGQPFQVYSLTRGKMKASDATTAVMGKMIVYQVAIVIVSTFALFVSYNKVAHSTKNFIILVFIGYFMNLFVLLFLLLTSTCKWFKRLIMKLFNLIGKIKWLKGKMENKKEGFENYLSDFQSSFKNLLKHPISLLASLSFQILNLIFMFVIPYFLLRGMGITSNNNFYLLIYVISLVALNSAFMCWLPTPGASGGAEFGLQTLLLTITGVNSGIALIVMLLWRFFTYYVTIIYGFISYLILERKIRKIEYNENISIEQ